ncbi:chymotrypsin inhibitor-like [Pseudomyrmex gracilis]|uniref:chymotrypsin inhibitor-like n=1 Tax=Pseudomyrmex gracilis TaxID=219809 RepID=UPI000994DF26|nr:chymotrypsin inhibitor-like [Pseudomyrmex gracilis]
MSRAVFTVLLVIGVLFSITGAQQCPENMQYTTCGSACPRSCIPNSGRCSKDCVVGCQCNPGFLLNSQGNCVLPENC